MSYKDYLSVPIDQRPPRGPRPGMWVIHKLSGQPGIIVRLGQNLSLNEGTDPGDPPPLVLGALIHLTDDAGLTVTETVAAYDELDYLWPDDPRVPEPRRVKSSFAA